ncbi:MAG: hypothetical protein KAJ49_00605 [Arcobacteraceae bacterium]|nr:hypothetical protein [Arcobacteraceae bacterium]
MSQSLVQNDSENFFITKYEYGKMLYKNPRGISCEKCHGTDAKGKLISRFVHIRKKIKYNCIIESVDITTINYNDFIIKLDSTKKIKKIEFDKTQVCDKLVYGNTMPKYFLIKSEMDSIYYYITHIGENNE